MRTPRSRAQGASRPARCSASAPSAVVARGPLRRPATTSRSATSLSRRVDLLRHRGELARELGGCVGADAAQVDAELDRRERVAHLVGDPGHHAAQRREPVALRELDAQPLVLHPGAGQRAGEPGDVIGEIRQLGDRRARYGRMEVARERRQGGVERPGAAPNGDEGADGHPDQEEGRPDERDRDEAPGADQAQRSHRVDHPGEGAGLRRRGADDDDERGRRLDLIERDAVVLDRALAHRVEALAGRLVDVAARSLERGRRGHAPPAHAEHGAVPRELLRAVGPAAHRLEPIFTASRARSARYAR